MKSIFSFLILSLVFGLVSCKQNPYPTTGEIRQTERQEQKPVEPPLAMSVEDVIEYKEGRYREYKIRASVKDGGTPVLSVENLPKGLEFDEKEFLLKWRPNFFDGNDPVDPTIKSRIYPITVWLRDSNDSVRALKKIVNLVVYDVPQVIEVNTSNTTSVDEGKLFANTFTVDNADFPNGPFKIITSGMPANTQLVKVNDNTFRLEFSPDYYHVNRKLDGSSKRYQGKIIVTNPANHTVSEDLNITVNDRRLESKIVAPDILVQGLDVSFQVVGYDLNKEMSPQVSMLSSRPSFGKFSFSEIKNEESSSTVLNVTWSDIPPAYNGQEFSLGFRSCVQGTSSSYNNCKDSNTKVKILVRERKSPLISRSDWPTGEVVYLNHAETLTKKLMIRDGEDANLKTKIEIFPEEMRKFVTWSNDTLKMNFTLPGIFQFNVKATSDYNASSSESFLVEVFPQNRNKTIFLADSTRDPEAVFYKNTFKNIDIMNPLIQDVNVRNVSGRDTLVIGTSILLDKEANVTIMKAINNIKNVVIATSLVENLPEKFLDQLRNKYDLVTIGRYSQLPNLPDLSKMMVAKTKQFKTPNSPVYLKLNSTQESKDPMLFNGGLYEPDKKCKGILGLSIDGTNPYVLGVVCNRDNGGRITLLGTEWSDLKVAVGDEGVPFDWFNTMLNGKF